MPLRMPPSAGSGSCRSVRLSDFSLAFVAASRPMSVIGAKSASFCKRSFVQPLGYQHQSAWLSIRFLPMPSCDSQADHHHSRQLSPRQPDWLGLRTHGC